MPNETLRVDANGLTFAALAWGDPESPLALLLHGYPDTAHTWRHMGPHLADHGWRAVAPFMRGYAPTDLAPDDRYSIRELRADTVALHSALGGDDRAALVGHDFGAVVAGSVAAHEPGRFAHVVTMAVPPGRGLLRAMTRPRTLGLAGSQLRMSWYMLFHQLPGISERAMDRLIPRLWRDWSPGYDAAEDLPRVFEALRGPQRRRAALRYYRDCLNPRFVMETFGPAPRQPILHLHGERDGCIAPGHITLAPDLLAGGRAEILPGVGHFMQLEDPERVNALVTAWVGAPR